MHYNAEREIICTCDAVRYTADSKPAADVPKTSCSPSARYFDSRRIPPRRRPPGDGTVIGDCAAAVRDLSSKNRTKVKDVLLPVIQHWQRAEHPH